MICILVILFVSFKLTVCFFLSRLYLYREELDSYENMILIVGALGGMLGEIPTLYLLFSLF